MIKKFDPSGMHKIYDKWPQIAKEACETNYETADFKNIDHIVFSGMGGSGAIGDMMSSILSTTDIHFCVVKGYTLPKTINSNTLVITTSISGNTAESLEVLNSAIKLPCKIIAFSSGGKMRDFCMKNNITYREIQQFHSPRASFPIFLFSMLKILNPIFAIPEKEIKQSISGLESLQKRICSSNLTNGNPSLDLAKWIKGIPMIYHPWGLQAAATRFKNSLNENAKLQAMTENVIETCHNGIVAWERRSNVQPILLEGKDDYVKTKERWKILKEYFHINNIEYREVVSGDGNILTKLIYLIYLLDYATIYLSVISGIDPAPIKSIDFIKSRS